MKKLLFFATSMLLLVSCGMRGVKITEAMNKAEKLAAEETISVEETIPAEETISVEEATVEAVEAVEQPVEVVLPKVYSNAYDGYLNVRAEPTTKSQVVGKLSNGPEGAELLGVEGKWSKVRVNGVEGYVSSAYVQSEPTAAVYIDAKHVVGHFGWVDSMFTEWVYSINSNGKYSYSDDCGDGEGESGKWYLSGTSIVFKPNYGQPRTLKVDAQKKCLIDGNKEYSRLN